MVLSEAEQARRRPVWMVLSELWLDAELGEEDLRRIAGVLRASGYGIEALQGIYRFEVAPAVSYNLRVTAGVWTAFDPEWLCGRAAYQAARRSVLRERGLYLLGPWQTRAVEPTWQRVVRLLQQGDA